MSTPASDIEIARAASTESIQDIGEKLGIPGESLQPYGYTKARSVTTS